MPAATKPAVMLRNTVEDFIEKQGVNRYQFAKAVGISMSTVYRLVKDNTTIPAPEVLEKILSTYPGHSPNDLIVHLADEEAKDA